MVCTLVQARDRDPQFVAVVRLVTELWPCSLPARLNALAACIAALADESERGGPLGPFEDLEVIRIEQGMSTSRFCDLLDIPERLATLARQNPGTQTGQRSLAGPITRPAPSRCGDDGRQASRLGPSLDLGHGPARRAPALAVDGVRIMADEDLLLHGPGRRRSWVEGDG